jgi:hypothetical protein
MGWIESDRIGQLSTRWLPFPPAVLHSIHQIEKETEMSGFKMVGWFVVGEGKFGTYA